MLHVQWRLNKHSVAHKLFYDTHFTNNEKATFHVKKRVPQEVKDPF